MKAISLWQPWATAMAIGKKQNETRAWATSYRGDLLICAAARKPAVWERELLHGENNLPLGCALCVVELYSCEIIVKAPDDEDEAKLGDYSLGRFAWRTRRLRVLEEPIPWKGKQGIWTLSDEEERRVRMSIAKKKGWV